MQSILDNIFLELLFMELHITNVQVRKKRAIVSVTNDLATDQRVARSCSVLCDLGWEVVLVGRILPNSLPMDRPYRCVRFRLPFIRGAQFYAVYNIRLCWFLLFNRCDLFFSNDLDTLLPNFLISKLKHKPIIYDSHEYFTEVPEIQGRPFVQNTWKRIEKFCLSRLKSMITVNESIAKLFRNKYGIEVAVIRNVPFKICKSVTTSRSELGLPENPRIVILQGAGINIHRGAEEAVEAMKYVENVLLLIVGSGDVVPQLKEFVVENNLSDKVWFVGKQPSVQLRKYTAVADIGLSLDKPLNINYEYSLPNKLFDYIQAGIAVLASDLVEVANIVRQYQVGEVLAQHNPQAIANQIQAMLSNQVLLDKYRANAKKASEILCWEHEKAILEQLVTEINSKL